jgi:hypothetical protein
VKLVLAEMEECVKIHCDCGKFEAELTGPNTGRLACYCADCQAFAEKLGRADILDEFGGTQVVAVYPGNYKVLKGHEYLKLNKLSEKGLHRWSVSCCNSPVGNTVRAFPWVGIPHQAFDKEVLESMGPVKCRIMGKDCKGEPPFKISNKMSLRDAFHVMPFILKGKLFKTYRGSPFFKEDGKTPIAEATILD